jgi:hypothetical protein
MPGGLEQVPKDGFAILSGSFKPQRQGLDERVSDLRPITGEKIVYAVA